MWIPHGPAQAARGEGCGAYPEPVIRTQTSTTDRDAEELWPVYDEIFGDSDRDAWLRDVWTRHRDRDGFRLCRAYQDSQLIGFAYGYTGHAGQWWTDAVRGTLPPAVSGQWLGNHFELVSIGVLPTHRGNGIGRTLLEAITAGVPHRRRLLMTTADTDDPARRLYASCGWRTLGPGTATDTVVLGIPDPAVLRPLQTTDLGELMVLQRAGAVAGLGHIFPQGTHPFPADEIRRRWARELDDPAIDAYAVIDDHRLTGFTAVRGEELLHFGTAVHTWGSGLAGLAHDATLAHLMRAGVRRAHLLVFEENVRAVRFYERRGWRATAERSRTSFAPHPVLRTYRIDLH